VPDPSSIELMIVSCQWNLLGPNSFDDFPKNGTKSLAIQCTKMPNSTEREENPLTKAGTFQGFDELRELKIVVSEKAKKFSGNIFTFRDAKLTIWPVTYSSILSPIFVHCPSPKCHHSNGLNQISLRLWPN
jgi:hypothetical protein